jgi:hypothetical protein
VNPAQITSPPRIGKPRSLWPLGVVLILYQRGQKSRNVETLNWYIDPHEFEEVRRGMDQYPEGASSANTTAPVGSNYLREKSLSKWWSIRGGKVKEG